MLRIALIGVVVVAGVLVAIVATRNMDTMIGGQFEQGLATLDGVTSAVAAPAAAGARG
jgi:hypothetical protein